MSADYYIGGFIITLSGWLIIPRIKRSIDAKAAAQNRIREFFDFVMQFKAEIFAGRLPDFWVPYFLQNAPQLKAGFDQIAGDLNDADRSRLSKQIDTVLAFSSLNPANIYEQQDNLFNAIDKIERF